ncbi:hypothetical protein [Streptomyces shenzhenensis]|uniref:Uncharacterized protein n=1 Tax=Streptomyces shenzhenensis TaxID=943815 RepID=A0A3M0I3E7_9ACTN|nr:hypothetical protein [Streptomyces shenzhenensis]RMB81283.1 hypothetical protein CTZ28_35355 [Streptomyces shenzhenensis]
MWVSAVGDGHLVNMQLVARLSVALISGNLWVVKAHTAEGDITLDLGPYPVKDDAIAALQDLVIRGGI